jgi:type IV secretion system protein VirD4
LAEEVSYRLPDAPEDIGNLYGSALLVALLVAFLGTFGATQYVAWHFGYHPNLGAPAFRLWDVSVYNPFLIFQWLAQYRRASQPVPGFLLNALFATGGSWVIALLLYSSRKQAAVSRLQSRRESVQGSSRLATLSDVSAAGLLGSSGVYVGGFRDGNTLRYLLHDGPDHVLVFAPNRSGKGVSLVIPTLLEWRHSVVVFDIKGENWHNSAGYRSGWTTCYRFAPAEEASARFNPLAEIRLDTHWAVADAQRIADMLVQGGINAAEPYWYETAGSLLTGVILFACHRAKAKGQTATLADVNYLLKDPQRPFRPKPDLMVDLGRKTAPPKSTLELMLDCPDPIVKRKAREMIEKEDKDFGGVHSTAKTAMRIFDDPLVCANTSTSDFRVEDLMDGERPASLYIVQPPDDLARLRPLVRVMLTLFVDRLCSIPYGQTHRHRLLLLIDEFPQLKRLPVFAETISFMAGYGIKCYLIAQDITQIWNAYGKLESITTNCNVRVAAAAPNTWDTAKLLSDMAGFMTVRDPHVSYSGNRWASPKSQTVNVGLVHRPVMYPDEIMRLRMPKRLVKDGRDRLVAPGQMLIFVAGSFPVLGTQMLFFLDPEFRRRNAIPPPIVWNLHADRVDTPVVEATYEALPAGVTVDDDAPGPNEEPDEIDSNLWPV